MGMQKYMFVDLFIHGATVSECLRWARRNGRPWEAGVSPGPAPRVPLWKVVCGAFSPWGSPLSPSVPLSPSPIQQ